MRLIILPISALIVFTIITFSMLGLLNVYSQVDSLRFNSTQPSIYDDPSKLLNFQYPSFWKVIEIPHTNAVLIQSPIKTVGILLESKNLSNQSVDEVLMEDIAKIKGGLPNVQVINSSAMPSDNNSIVHKIIYTYGDNSNTYKAFQILSFSKHQLYNFIYYSNTDIFDNFLDMAQSIYNSLSVPTSEISKLEGLTNGSTINKAVQFGLNSESKINNLIPNATDDKPSNTQFQDNILSYNNSNIGVQIKYPAYLVKMENEQGISITTKNNSNGLIIVKVPVNGISHEEFALKQLSSLNQSLSNFNVINSSVTDLLDYPTQLIYFEYNNGSELYRGMQFWKITSENAYIVTYFGQSDRMFEEFLPTASRIIETLVINSSR